MTLLMRIADLVLDRPLLYHPGKAEALVMALGPRITGHAVTVVNGDGAIDHRAFAAGRPSAGVVGDRLGRAHDDRGIAPFDMIDGVALVPIEGTLVYKGGYLGSASGETSYQGLQTQILRAKARPDVRAVVFEVDSFGGQVNGAFETAAMMRDLSRAKPTIAILTDFACSAAYLLASQARQIVVPEFGGAGSIGVVMLHADHSGRLDQDGIKVTLIHAGRHKVEGNPYQPLPDRTRDAWQSEADAIRDRLAAEVGKGRGSRFTKAAALRTEAESYTAAQALELGLVDAIADPREAFAAFLSGIKRSS